MSFAIAAATSASFGVLFMFIAKEPNMDKIHLASTARLKENIGTE